MCVLPLSLSWLVCTFPCTGLGLHCTYSNYTCNLSRRQLPMADPCGPPILACPTCPVVLASLTDTYVAHCCLRQPFLVNSYLPCKAQFECLLLHYPGDPLPPTARYSSSSVPLFGHIPISPTRLSASRRPHPSHLAAQMLSWYVYLWLRITVGRKKPERNPQETSEPKSLWTIPLIYRGPASFLFPFLCPNLQ